MQNFDDFWWNPPVIFQKISECVRSLWILLQKNCGVFGIDPSHMLAHHGAGIFTYKNWFI